MRQLLLLIAIAASQAFSQDDLEALRRTRLEKTEVILRIQDRRTLHDGKLISLLADPDALVRRRAYMAYGSIQDSTAIGLLTHGLADPDVTVQEAAAFALGQTGAILSTDTRAQLGHDLIWNRLNATQVPEVLIEEIGKFGTAEALQDLVIRVGDVYPRRFENGMTMAIARFALRGITDPGAVRYLLAGLRLSAQPAWQSVYALQRIGDHPTIRSDIEHLMLLRQDNDPLVRMNLAALLAKMRDVRAAREPLLRLASADPDWRVRVNALRALAVQPVASDVAVLDVFRRAFYDANMHVALAALAALRSSDITAADTSGQAREILQHMSAMVTNTGNEFPWQYQAEAAATLATLLRSAALPSFPAKAWPNPRLRSDLLRAMGTTGDSSAGPPLLAALNDDREDIRCAALEGLASLATLRPSDAGLHRSIRSALPELCKSEDVALVATAAGILADSLFADNTSAPTLLALIPDLQGADDGEALVEVIRALGKLGDTRAVPHLLEILSRSERTVATEAAAALQRITGRDYAGRITAREPFFTDFDFTYLRGLPDTIHIEISTSRGDITAEFYKELAPFAVMSILKLSSQRGFYRGLSFHRVVPNFVIQGGCPRGDGWGGPGFTLRSEFSPVRFQAGTIGIASAGKDTEGSQFFITHAPQPHLDGRYTIIGRVVKGQEIVNAIQRDDRLFDIRVVE